MMTFYLLLTVAFDTVDPKFCRTLIEENESRCYCLAGRGEGCSVLPRRGGRSLQVSGVSIHQVPLRLLIWLSHGSFGLAHGGGGGGGERVGGGDGRAGEFGGGGRGRVVMNVCVGLIKGC